MLEGRPRLSAIDCVEHGTASLRASWPVLAGARVLRNLVLLLLMALSLVPPLAVIGFDVWGDLPHDANDALDWLATFVGRLAPTPALLGAFGVMLGVWLLAGYLYCYFQAGLFGVLDAAEQNRGVRFRWADFDRFGRRRLNPMFALANLYGAIIGGLMVLGLLIALAGVGAARTGGAPGVLAGLGIGCAGLAPIFVLLVGSGLWFDLACAQLVREGSNVRGAARDAWWILRRRVGTVGLLLVLFMAASMVIQVALSPFSAMASFTSNGETLRLIAGQLVSNLLGLVPSAFIESVFAGSLVALVASEAFRA